VYEVLFTVGLRRGVVVSGVRRMSGFTPAQPTAELLVTVFVGTMKLKLICKEYLTAA